MAIFGILVFSGAIKIGSNNSPGSLGTVTLWGTVKSSLMSSIVEQFNKENPTIILKYQQKSADSFDQDLLEALASGTGPDIFLLPDNLAFHYANKIFTVPYSSFPVVSFKNSFAGAGEIFLTSNGTLSFPLSVDPLVMYYNRSTLDTNGIVSPPTSWDELASLVPVLTKRDESGKIIKSTVALGHFSNVNNAKDILAAMFMQTGNQIVSENNGVFSSDLNTLAFNYNLPSILKFYTNFADPNQGVYSWNRSFSISNDAFSREDSAFYFGFASELKSLINRNPNQNLAVAPFPQNKNVGFKLTGAHVTGVSILASSKNFNAAYTVANLMATGNFAAKFAEVTGTVPARRDLLRNKPEDSFSPIFYNSALYSRSWMDPSPSGTNDIFRSMIDGVLANNMTVDNAISDASAKLNLLLAK